MLKTGNRGLVSNSSNVLQLSGPSGDKRADVGAGATTEFQFVSPNSCISFQLEYELMLYIKHLSLISECTGSSSFLCLLDSILR